MTTIKYDAHVQSIWKYTLAMHCCHSPSQRFFFWCWSEVVTIDVVNVCWHLFWALKKIKWKTLWPMYRFFLEFIFFWIYFLNKSFFFFYFLLFSLFFSLFFFKKNSFLNFSLKKSFLFSYLKKIKIWFILFSKFLNFVL